MRKQRTHFVAIIAIASSAFASCSTRTPFIRPPAPGLSPDVSGEAIAQRLLLIGDAGHFEGGRELLTKAGGFAAQQPTLVIYLGDNSYDDGVAVVPGSTMARALTQQIRVGQGGRVLFIPGNHDWEQTGKDRYQARRLAQEQFVRSSSIGGAAEVDYLPSQACPGPTVLSLHSAKIIAIDSNWWFLTEAQRKTPAHCAFNTESEIQSELKKQLACASSPCKPAVVVAHHPLETYGIHGGKGPWYQGIYVLVRRALRVRQDVGSTAYKNYIRSLEGAFEDRPPLAFVAGHEHSLQVGKGITENSGWYQLVSGSGSKSGFVSRGDRTLFSQGKKGLMTLDFMKSGRVLLRVYSWDDHRKLLSPIFWTWLTDVEGD